MLEKLVASFRTNVLTQWAEIHAGRNGNRYARAYIRVFERLTERYGDQGREALMVLLDDPSPEVRVAAASFLLRFAHDKARDVLLADADNNGAIGLIASECLKRWEEGAWQLDPA